MSFSRRSLLAHLGRLSLGVPAMTAVGLPGAASAADAVRASKRTEPAGEVRQGAALTAGAVGAIESLNPYTVSPYGPAFDALSGAMEGLFALDSKQRRQPALAEGVAIGDDGVTYTVTLREGVTFHNGDPFGAEDVVASWRMITNPDLPVWSRLGWDQIETIEASDARTVVVTTTGIYAPFLNNISAGAFNNGLICPVGSLAEGPGAFAEAFAANPIGTGPMRIAEVADDRIILERFRDYWGEPASLRRVVLRLFPDHESQMEALRQGELDLVGRTGTLTAPFVAEALAIPDVATLHFPALSWGHLDLKQIGFLRETAVRQALDVATPSRRIIDEVLAGHGTRAFADQAPGSWAYHSDVRPRPYDRDQAMALLDEAGLTAGDDGVRERDGLRFEIELWAETTDPQAPRIVELIAESWNAIGIRTVTKFADEPTLWGPLGYQFSDAMTACYYRWSNVNDPDDMFIWHSSQIPTSPGGPGGNLPAFFHDYSFQVEIDDLTARAAAEPDQEARAALYRQIQELLHEEVPVIFIFWDTSYSAAANTVGGFWPSSFTYLLWNVREWFAVSS